MSSIIFTVCVIMKKEIQSVEAITEALKQHYNYKKDNQLYEKFGVKSSTFSTWKTKNRLKPIYNVIFAKCENINGHWLLTGEGDPFLKKEKPKNFSDIYKPRKKKELRDPYKKPFVPEIVAVADQLDHTDRLKLFRIACLLSEIGGCEIVKSDGGNNDPVLNEK